MRLNKLTFGKVLLPIGFMLAALVIAGSTLEWPSAMVYALTASDVRRVLRGPLGGAPR